MHHPHPTRIRRRRDLERAVAHLVRRDNVLAHAVKQAGPVEFKMRPAGYASLLKIIVEQQLSTASAWAIWGRLEAGVTPLEPERLLTMHESDLRAFGLSGPKIRYCRALSQDVVDGALDLKRLARFSDAAAMAALQSVTGIGRWTAEIYLLFCLGRADVWPVGDIAVQAALHEAQGLKARPGPEEMDELGEQWRPLRGVAALILWNYYRHIKARPLWE